MVDLITLVEVARAGVMVKPTSLVSTEVIVEYTSGDCCVIVAVTFSVVVLRMADCVSVTIDVIFRIVVDMIVAALAVSVNVDVMVEGRALEEARLEIAELETTALDVLEGRAELTEPDADTQL